MCLRSEIFDDIVEHKMKGSRSRCQYIRIFRDKLKTPIPLEGDSATIRNFGQNDTNRNRNGKSAVEVQ